MTNASIIEKKDDASSFHVLPHRGHPIPPSIFSLLHKTHTSTLTSAYPPNLLQVSL